MSIVEGVVPMRSDTNGNWRFVRQVPVATIKPEIPVLADSLDVGGFLIRQVPVPRVQSEVPMLASRAGIWSFNIWKVPVATTKPEVPNDATDTLRRW